MGKGAKCRGWGCEPSSLVLLLRKSCECSVNTLVIADLSIVRVIVLLTSSTISYEPQISLPFMSMRFPIRVIPVQIIKLTESFKCNT
jgi:hypothetical protein